MLLHSHLVVPVLHVVASKPWVRDIVLPSLEYKLANGSTTSKR